MTELNLRIFLLKLVQAVYEFVYGCLGPLFCAGISATYRKLAVAEGMIVREGGVLLL